MSQAAAPVITSSAGQQRITEGQFHLGKVAANEIALVKIKLFPSFFLQNFTCQQKPGAAIEQQTGGLRRGNLRGIEVSLAAGKNPVIATDDPVGRNQVVTEHRDRTAA